MKSDYQLLKNTYAITERFRGVQSSSGGSSLSGHRSGYNFPGSYSSNVYGLTPVGDVNFVYNDPYYNSHLQYSSNTNSKFILSLYNMALNYSNNPSEEEKKNQKDECNKKYYIGAKEKFKQYYIDNQEKLKQYQKDYQAKKKAILI